jgi:hypothetical protein
MIQPTTPTTRPTTRLMLSPDRQNATTTIHDTHWHYDPVMSLSDVNGAYPIRNWGIRQPATGNVYGPGSNCDEHLSRLDVFLMMMPLEQLELIVYCTNKQLTAKKKKETTTGAVAEAAS